jgi:hypothetical protein
MSSVLKRRKTSQRKVATTSDKAVNIQIFLATFVWRVSLVGRSYPLLKAAKLRSSKGGYKAASKDWNKLEAFFRANPRLNYGIVTGEASRFFVVDIDGPKGRANPPELAREHRALPKTVVQLTPNKGATFGRYRGCGILSFGNDHGFRPRQS